MIVKRIEDILNNLDNLFSVFGVLLGIVLMILPFFSTNFTPISTIFGFLIIFFIGIYFFKKQNFTEFKMVDQKLSPRIQIIINILFFFVLISMILLLYYNEDVYVRPPLFFLFSFLLIGITTFDIIYLSNKRSFQYLSLIKVIIIPFCLQWSQMLLFSPVIGVDALNHQNYSIRILELHYIPMYQTSYFSAATTNLISIITIELSGLNYKISTLFSISFFQIIVTILFVYLLGTFLFNKKIGLYAALILGISKYFNSWIYWVVPFSVAAIFIPLIIYCLFKFGENGDNNNNNNISWYKIIIFISLFTLMTMHPLTCLATNFLLYLFWGIIILFNKIYSKKYYNISLILTIFFSILSISWWVFISRDVYIFSNLIKFRLDPIAINSGGDAFINFSNYLQEIPFIELLFNSQGTMFFWILSIPACLYMISKKSRNPLIFFIAFGGLTILAVTYFTSFFSQTIQILGYRWEYFGSILLSIPIAITIFFLAQISKKIHVQNFIAILLIIILSFVTIMGPLQNIDSPLFKDTTLSRPVLIESELQAINSVPLYTDKLIYLDKRAVDQYRTYNGSKLYPKDNIRVNQYGAFFSKDFTEYRQGIIIIRNELSENALAQSGYSLIKINYRPGDLLAKTGYSKIYNSGSTSAFYFI